MLDEATGGNQPIEYKLTPTSAPVGSTVTVSFNKSTRVMSFTPDRVGTWTFTYKAEDADGERDTQQITVVIVDPTPDFAVLFTIPRSWRSWAVWSPGVINVQITPPPGISLGDWKFRFIVKDSVTGFSIVTEKGHCRTASKKNESDWILGTVFNPGPWRFPVVPV